MQFHPASLLFPQMDQQRFGELKESIRTDGLLVPITIFAGEVLDGRHRWRACEELGVAPKTIEFVGNPWRYVVAMNAQRRDLLEAVRALACIRAFEASDRWESANEARQEAGNKKRSEATKTRPRKEDGTLGPVRHQSDGGLDDKGRSRAKSAEIAQAANVSTATVDRMAELNRKRPDLADRVLSGELKPTRARREMTKGELATKVEALPAHQHRVIYADPPWKYGDEREGLTDYADSAAAGQYPTLSVAELCALDIRSIAAPDAVLFCWATFPLLPDALEVVRAWGFQYKTAIVWDKGRPNLGNYHDARAELLLICTRGSCTPDKTTDRPKQVIAHPRGKHSAKPEIFRETIDAMYPIGPRIELFRRGAAPKGWAIWGNEAAA